MSCYNSHSLFLIFSAHSRFSKMAFGYIKRKISVRGNDVDINSLKYMKEKVLSIHKMEELTSKLKT